MLEMFVIFHKMALSLFCHIISFQFLFSFDSLYTVHFSVMDNNFFHFCLSYTFIKYDVCIFATGTQGIKEEA